MSVRLRRIERRFSLPDCARPSSLETCRPSHPYSLEALDLSTASPIETLASLRFLVLSYLADLEARLSRLASPISDLGITEVLKAQGESTIEEGRAWANVALEMLDSIRADVLSHFPESYFANISVDNFVKSHMPEVTALHNMRSHLPEMPDVRSRFPEIPNLLDIPTVYSRLPEMSDVRSHLPDIPNVRSHLSDMYNVRSHLPDMPSVRSHLPEFTLDDMRSKLDGVRTRLSDLDFNRPLNFIPTLYERLQSLHSHLLSMEPPSTVDFSSLAPSVLLSDLLRTLRQSEIISDLLRVPPDVSAAEDMLGRAAKEVAGAVRRSLHGARLIRYADLPAQWRSNPFVRQGYRFIPIERWHLIIMSLFALHNETLNIHTHLVPCILWGWNSIPFLSSSALLDVPETAFTTFALLCLFTSALWHTMAGCAHPAGVEFFARVDYVGIGWLISASVGTVVHYGFQCHPKTGYFFLACCFMTGLAGNIFPFMAWFNKYECRHWRVVFFMSLAFSSVAPLVVLACLHSTRDAISFVEPVFPSLLSYLAGLVFYTTHFPERFLSERWTRCLDFVGGGSHAIWHLFVVLAISQHKAAIWSMRNGINGCTPAP